MASPAWWKYVLGLGALGGAGYLLLSSDTEPRSSLPALPGQKDDFARQLWAAIQNAAPSLPDQSKLMLLAQAVFETGWGRTIGWRDGWNAFNITRAPNDPRPVVMGPDTECTPDGDCSKKITQRFAAYGSPEESVQDYLSFISARRYGQARQKLESGDVYGWLADLYTGGYFTLPLDKYYSQVSAILPGLMARLA